MYALLFKFITSLNMTGAETLETLLLLRNSGNNRIRQFHTLETNMEANCLFFVKANMSFSHLKNYIPHISKPSSDEWRHKCRHLPAHQTQRPARGILAVVFLCHHIDLRQTTEALLRDSLFQNPVF